MKKIIISFLASVACLTALQSAEKKVDGEAVFERACASCHIKMITGEETKKVFKTLKAPPMIEISNKIKGNIKINDDLDDELHRAVVIAFVKDYILYPHLDKSMCKPMALDHFGVMPSLKGKITPEEINAVSAWVYDYYIGKTF